MGQTWQLHLRQEVEERHEIQNEARLNVPDLLLSND